MVDNTVRFEVLKMIGTLKALSTFEDDTDSPIILEARKVHIEQSTRIINMLKDCHTDEDLKIVADELEANPPTLYNEVLKRVSMKYANREDISDAG